MREVINPWRSDVRAQSVSPERESHMVDADAQAQLIARLATTSGAARDEAEREYIRLIEQRCDALIQHAPTALADAALAVPLDLLREPRNRQLIRYYRGLGLGLCDKFGPALEAFEQLLAEPDLDDTMRARTLNSGALFAQIQGQYERALAW